MTTGENEQWVVPGAPAIAGLTFRHYRDERDYPAIVAVINGSKLADGLDHMETVADLALDYRHTQHFTPQQDTLLAEVQGEVIAYSRGAWIKEEGANYIHYHAHYLLPAWRDQGLEPVMFHALEQRGAATVADHPADVPSVLETWVSETETAQEALVQAAGYRPVRHFIKMKRPLDDEIPPAPLPDGIEVRPALPEHYPAIWAAMQEAFRDHWGYCPPPEGAYERWLGERLSQPALWQVAWTGDQVVGMVLNFINDEENQAHQRRRGYTESISVRRPWRKQGIARALILRSLRLLQGQGMTEAALTVDAENLSGALRLYEQVGFRAVRRTTAYQKPL